MIASVRRRPVGSRTLLARLLGCVVLVLACVPEAPPNLVLISLDTVRADHLSVYGYHRPTSPSLERLAADGLLFTRATSTSTWTLPSTATMLTGLLPDQHGLRSLRDALPPGVVTLAERLRNRGYRTAAFTDGGFVGTRWGFPQGFDSFEATEGKAWGPKDVAPIVEASRAWLREGRQEPFFLFVHTYEAHQPYTNPEGFADPFLDPAYDGPLGQRVRAPVLLEGGPADRTWAMALYDGEIARADHYLGRLLDTLRDTGLDERTAVLVTSDHGEEFLEHGGVDHGHGKVFEENVRIPMILKPPAGRRATIASPVSLLDVAPTLLELAGVAAPELAGRSLLRALGDPQLRRPVLVHGLNSFPGLDEERFRLDLGARSLVLDRNRGDLFLFDRAADPEMRRTLSVAAAPELVDRLQTILAWSASGGRALARLPAGPESLRIPRTSAIRPLGLWQGLSWRPLEGEREVRLEGGPAALVFDIDPGPAGSEPDGGLVVELGRPGGAERRTLRTDRPGPGWSPLAGELPDVLRAVPTAAIRERLAAELDDEARDELRSLGYLE